MAKKTDSSDAVVTAAMALAAERGWRSVSLAHIAERAGISLADLVEQFHSKDAIVGAYFKGIDTRMLAGGFDAKTPVRDRLFDAMMRRFEAMAPDRAALSSIFWSLGERPVTALKVACRLSRTMALVLESAGLSSTGLSGMARVQGITAVYVYALRTFLKDDSPDLAKTMAALDKALKNAERLAGGGRDHGRPASTAGAGETAQEST